MAFFDFGWLSPGLTLSSARRASSGSRGARVTRSSSSRFTGLESVTVPILRCWPVTSVLARTVFEWSTRGSDPTPDASKAPMVNQTCPAGKAPPDRGKVVLPKSFPAR